MSLGIILAFAPFIVFAIADRYTTPAVALLAGGVVALALVARDLLISKSPPKILESGSAILFLGLAAYAWFAAPAWSVFAVRLFVDAGLLLVIVVSMLIRQPFTIQYARAKVAREYWDSPRFVHVNTVITTAWAIAFVVIVLVDFVMTLMPNGSQSTAFIAIVAAIYVAYKFTVWYPKQSSAKVQS